jgi:homoserine kinase
MAAKSNSNRLTFKATMAQVSVPATSANLGPGFDSFGLALDYRDQYAAAVLDEATIDIDITGEGEASLKRDKSNLIYKAMQAGFEYMGQQPRGLAIRQLNNIPHGRGLGSSAAAIVGGLFLARNLVLDGENMLTKDAILQIASQMEGHPDNVSAAIYGGATISWSDPISERYQSIQLKVDSKIHALAFIPNNELPTSKARKLLPETIPFGDAVKNSARAALFSTALTNHPELLFIATEDFLHQKYRQDAYAKSYALVEFLRGAGLSAFISGAGPSVLMLETQLKEDFEIENSVQKAFGDLFRVEKLAISAAGAL